MALVEGVVGNSKGKMNVTTDEDHVPDGGIADVLQDAPQLHLGPTNAISIAIRPAIVPSVLWTRPACWKTERNGRADELPSGARRAKCLQEPSVLSRSKYGLHLWGFALLLGFMQAPVGAAVKDEELGVWPPPCGAIYAVRLFLRTDHWPILEERLCPISQKLLLARIHKSLRTPIICDLMVVPCVEDGRGSKETSVDWIL
mmetsp:Transcript_105060/g.186137  ORF Transcript_105060/g.186137 Transcript_105060/m.186137 type:complete len:201 (+) Transcript_105060:294-896(+)